jgi:hypothetical protein
MAPTSVLCWFSQPLGPPLLPPQQQPWEELHLRVVSLVVMDNWDHGKGGEQTAREAEASARKVARVRKVGKCILSVVVLVLFDVVCWISYWLRGILYDVQMLMLMLMLMSIRILRVLWFFYIHF